MSTKYLRYQSTETKREGEMEKHTEGETDDMAERQYGFSLGVLIIWKRNCFLCCCRTLQLFYNFFLVSIQKYKYYIVYNI